MTALSRGTPNEIRFMTEDANDLAVLDGHCQHTGESRTDVMRMLLHKWAESELHRSILICRTTGRNPFAPDSNRTGENE